MVVYIEVWWPIVVPPLRVRISAQRWFEGGRSRSVKYVTKKVRKHYRPRLANKGFCLIVSYIFFL